MKICIFKIIPTGVCFNNSINGRLRDAVFRKEWTWFFLLFTKWQSCFVTGIWNAKLYWTECKASNFAFTILNELLWLLPDTPQTYPKCFLGSLRSILGVLSSFPPFSLWLTAVIFFFSVVASDKKRQLCSTGSTSDDACQKYRGHCSPKWLRLLLA